ncbi:DUF192 domain-containing protein [Planctomycetota bacterium]
MKKRLIVFLVLISLLFNICQAEDNAIDQELLQVNLPTPAAFDLGEEINLVGFRNLHKVECSIQYPLKPGITVWSAKESYYYITTQEGYTNTYRMTEKNVGFFLKPVDTQKKAKDVVRFFHEGLIISDRERYAMIANVLTGLGYEEHFRPQVFGLHVNRRHERWELVFLEYKKPQPFSSGDSLAIVLHKFALTNEGFIAFESTVIFSAPSARWPGQEPGREISKKQRQQRRKQFIRIIDSILGLQKIQVGSAFLYVEIANTPKQRTQGLMFRKNLPANAGMIFVYSQEQQLSFWMKNTFIPLSIAFLDRNGRIVSLADLKPLDLTAVDSRFPAKYALEVNQGWFKNNNIQIGNKVKGIEYIFVE